MNLRKHAAVTVAALALGLSAAPVATAVAADTPAKAPCATQQTQLDRAEAKLDALTARFAAKQAKVREAKGAVKAADTAKEKRSAKATLALAKEKKATVKKAKKAQAQRVLHAQARLDKCLAAHPA
ncbi:hypothetical protein [Pimelobacter simplex]|uniref:hypothetical protein n=1 Tax=Nocardioides simplex TaxID=2045 RepID=UPI00214F6D12|nr:hypothetical protein [Pimelobacter simplex]UUW88188.1 hypothetical protein M0M43_20935 [Pimelobacter simplex]UUW97693.1 hypothetical protein M0M48_09580 [Pimelobacter simplex]